MKIPLILASSSPARLELLMQIFVKPDLISPADIDEKQLPKENARQMSSRLARAKAEKIAAGIENGIIIGSDTVPICKNKILHKAASVSDVRDSIKLLSGRRHNLYTSVCVIRRENGISKILQKTVRTIIKFRYITDQEIEFYAQTNEGIGKAGGYTLTGYADSFVTYLSGSFSNVIGLPLKEVKNMLITAGYKFPYQ